VTPPPLHHHAARIIAGTALLGVAAIAYAIATIPPPVQWWRRMPT
jgi:hypothetical protein